MTTCKDCKYWGENMKDSDEDTAITCRVNIPHWADTEKTHMVEYEAFSADDPGASYCDCFEPVEKNEE